MNKRKKKLARYSHGLATALGLICDRLEATTDYRPKSEDRDHLLKGDRVAILIARDLLEGYSEIVRK